MAYVDIQNGDDSDGILLKLNKGLALADKSVTSVDTMQELCDLPTDLGMYLNATTSGFHSADGGGGGTFYWDAIRSKTEHTGGTIIDPLKGDQLGDSWPGTWFTPASTGDGCWVRNVEGNAVTPELFGVRGDGVTDDSAALAVCHAAGKNVEYAGSSIYVVTAANALKIFDGNMYRGNGCKILIPASGDASVPDHIFGRFDSNVFYRDTESALSADIEVSGFCVEIARAGYNFIGGKTVDVAQLPNSVGMLRIFGNTLINVGTPSGQGDVTTTAYTAGAFTDFNGLPVDIHHNSVDDCGNGIIAFNSPFCRIHENILRFCGVSKDFTSWSNVSAILVRGSLYQNVHDNFIYVTGGTSVFLSTESEKIEVVKCINNQIIGAGLSAIGAGTRAGLPARVEIDSITITGNTVAGFACGISATLHGGIGVVLDDSHDSTIETVKLDNTIDYLAPWETFNETTNVVDGSYNINKTLGNDVGDQQGCRILGGTSSGINNVIVSGEVLNHQRMGFFIQSVRNVIADIKALNCGWSKTISGTAFSLQNGALFKNIATADIVFLARDQSRGVAVNSAYCAPLVLQDVGDSMLDLRCQASHNQTRALRLIAEAPGNTLKIRSLVCDKIYMEGGLVNVVDDSAGTHTRSTIVEWTGENTARLIGSRLLSLGHSAVSMDKAYVAPKTVTLNSAAYYKKSRILFTANVNTLTITPYGSETIDGVTGNFILSIGDKKILYSDGSAWWVLDGA